MRPLAFLAAPSSKFHGPKMDRFHDGLDSRAVGPELA